MGLTMMCWNGLKGSIKLVALPVTKIRNSRRVGKVVRWSLHLFCLAAALAGLGLLNYTLGLDRLLRVPWPLLRMVWLPLLFLLVYLLVWMGWWLWQLWETGPQASAHPEVERAWDEARQALERAGIDLAATPMFLILGRPDGGEASLFNAARLPLVVPPVPRADDAPLRVAANAEGIYVSCAGISLLARQAALLAEPPGDAPSESEDWLSEIEPSSTSDRAEEPEPFPAALGGRPAETGSASAGQQQLEDAVALLVEEDDRPLAEAKTGNRPAAARTAPRPRRLDDVEELEHRTAQLKHLCGLIVRDRRPYCPINGLLVLVPFAATDGQLEANETTVLLERDLDTVHEAMQVECPLVAVLSDLEKAPGTCRLLERFPEQQRTRRLGVTFPRLADCDAEALPEIIDEGVRWTCCDLIPPLVYRLAEGGQDAGGSGTEPGRSSNAELYRFMYEIRSRQQRLSRLLVRAIASGNPGRWRPGGLYLAATGADAVRQQGFAGGIFPQLLAMQDDVWWTREALAEDATCRRWARAGYAGMAFLVAIIAAAAVL